MKTQRIGIFGSLVSVLLISGSAFATSPTPPAAGGANKPCQSIVQACQSAGFIKGEFKEGKGLWRDCVNPIVQGKTVSAAIPLPTVDPSVVSACKAKNPKFGEGKIGQ